MAREYRTGLIIRENVVEWTTLSGSGTRLSVATQGGCVLEPAEPGEGQSRAELREDWARQLKAESGHVRGGLSLALSSEHTLVRILTLPVADPDELQGMVELQLDKISPFPVESMVVSYEILERREDSLKVLIAAARTDLVDDLANLVRPAGLRPKRIDAAVLGYWRLLTDAGEINAEDRHVILLLDGQVPEIIVTEAGQPVAFRSLGACEGLDESAFASEMAREVGYSLLTLELEHGAGAPGSVTVWHRGEAPAKLESELVAECACEVHMRPLAELAPASEGVARRMVARQAQTLDLTPPAWTSAVATRKFKKRMLGIAGVVIAVWLLAVGSFFGWIAVEQQRLAALTRVRDAWREPAVEVRNMRRRASAIRRYMDTTQSSLECLREICVLQPTGVDLTSYTYTKGQAIKVAGEAGDVNHVYEFKTKVDASSLFTRSTLNGPRLDRRTRKQVFEIDIALGGEEEI